MVLFVEQPRLHSRCVNYSGLLDFLYYRICLASFIPPWNDQNKTIRGSFLAPSSVEACHEQTSQSQYLSSVLPSSSHELKHTGAIFARSWWQIPGFIYFAAVPTGPLSDGVCQSVSCLSKWGSSEGGDWHLAQLSSNIESFSESNLVLIKLDLLFPNFRMYECSKIINFWCINYFIFF